jgi:hypothetical protein
MQTKAEVRARRMAQRFEEAGFTTEIKVEYHEATLYSDGRVMLPESVYVTGSADGPNRWPDPVPDLVRGRTRQPHSLATHSPRSPGEVRDPDLPGHR